MQMLNMSRFLISDTSAEHVITDRKETLSVRETNAFVSTGHCKPMMCSNCDVAAVCLCLS